MVAIALGCRKALGGGGGRLGVRVSPKFLFAHRGFQNTPLTLVGLHSWHCGQFLVLAGIAAGEPGLLKVVNE